SGDERFGPLRPWGAMETDSRRSAVAPRSKTPCDPKRRSAPRPSDIPTCRPAEGEDYARRIPPAHAAAVREGGQSERFLYGAPMTSGCPWQRYVFRAAQGGLGLGARALASVALSIFARPGAGPSARMPLARTCAVFQGLALSAWLSYGFSAEPAFVVAESQGMKPVGTREDVVAL